MKPNNNEEIKLSNSCFNFFYGKIALQPISSVVKIFVAKILVAKVSKAKMVSMKITDMLFNASQFLIVASCLSNYERQKYHDFFPKDLSIFTFLLAFIW